MPCLRRLRLIWTTDPRRIGMQKTDYTTYNYLSLMLPKVTRLLDLIFGKSATEEVGECLLIIYTTALGIVKEECIKIQIKYRYCMFIHIHILFINVIYF